MLRRWRDADRVPFAAMNADPEVMRWFPAPLTRAQSDAFVERIEAHFASEAARYALTVVDDVVSFTPVRNERSRAVMERIGLSFAGEFDHPWLAEDSPIRRHVLYRRRATAG